MIQSPGSALQMPEAEYCKINVIWKKRIIQPEIYFLPFISISGGGHCYFANPNFKCDFRETISSSGITITRLEQHEISFNFLNLWFDFSLKNDCDDFYIFQDSLATSNRISYNQFCTQIENCEECLLGDVNSDEIINILDILNLVSAIISGEDINCGDTNDDGSISVIDVINIINIILN